MVECKDYRIVLATGHLKQFCFFMFYKTQKTNQHLLLKRGYVEYNTQSKIPWFHDFHAKFIIIYLNFTNHLQVHVSPIFELQSTQQVLVGDDPSDNLLDVLRPRVWAKFSQLKGNETTHTEENIIVHHIRRKYYIRHFCLKHRSDPCDRHRTPSRPSD